jgi:hypothetical protein
MIREKYFEGDDGIDLEGNEEKKKWLFWFWTFGGNGNIE